MRLSRYVLALTLAVTGSCSTDVGSRGLAINDPLDLIDDVQGPLRLYVLPAETYSCEVLTGVVSPEVPDLPEGMFADAVADLGLTVTASRATAEVNIPGGDYTVLVRGKGTDPVTMRRDVFIATGCAAQMIADGETRDVRLTLLPIVGMGMCGDGTLSPDEQCEDGNTADGDGCSGGCRSEPFEVNTTAGGVQDRARVAGMRGQRWHTTFDSPDESFFRIRSFAPDGTVIATPSVLRNDVGIRDVGVGVTTGIQLVADPAVSGDGRLAITYIDFAVPRDVRVAFFDAIRMAEIASTALVVEENSVSNPAIAFAGDGATMVVYEQATSTTGLMGAVFAAGSTTPGAPFDVAGGMTRAASPDIAGTATGFVVAFTAGGNVHFQRFGSDGSAVDAGPAGNGAGTQDQPAVGAQPDGSFLVAWRDELADGAGTGIGARTFAADGMPVQDAFVLNTTTAAAQSDPSIASGNGAYAVAYLSGPGARARYLSAGGDPIPNQDLPPTTADFEVTTSATEISAGSGGTDGNGAFMAVFNQGDDITGRLFPLR